jgi:hypothetical protein
MQRLHLLQEILGKNAYIFQSEMNDYAHDFPSIDWPFPDRIFRPI